MTTQFINYKGANVRFSDQGTGTPVVLLHGYLESLEIYSDFAENIKSFCRVICIDLPGHGKSQVIDYTASTEQMGDAVNAVIEYLKLNKVVVIGHSMGGYAALAFAEKFGSKLLGFGLFHSVSWADLPEKRANRLREIELVKLGKKALIAHNNIPNGFASDNHEVLKNEIDKAIKIAAATSDEGIIAALNAMMDRPDRTEVLTQLAVPVFFAVGLKDNYIPSDKLLALTSLVSKRYVAVFENSGHMAFVEEKERAADELECYLRSL
jgi:pimeloyl-ACP methyl ester carboxylesterase